MATYVVGDLQGCFTPLQRLLDQVKFDPAFDHLWLAGDLVSRGKHSLQTLRFAKSLGPACISVLGNHDISLIASAYGAFAPHQSLQELFAAPDFAELIDWLRRRPLLHYDAEFNVAMVHAGISPAWTLEVAQQCAREAEACLQQDKPTAWLKDIYGNKPDSWQPNQFYSELDRQRYIINTFTRMRYCRADGSLEFKQKLAPAQVINKHPDLVPWFQHPQRCKIDTTLCFGHWSTLGYYQENNVIALDTGCVWGGCLTAVRIDKEKKRKYQVTCTEYGR